MIITPIEQAEAFVARTGATIHHGGSRAFYRPSTDSIQLPPREAFAGTATSTPAEAYTRPSSRADASYGPRDALQSPARQAFWRRGSSRCQSRQGQL
jgi:antirestriction protein ArdC